MLSTACLRGALTLAALGTALGGCSWLFVDGPPAAHRQLPYFECSSSRAWPVVDTVFAASTALEAAAIAGSSDRTGGANTAAIVAAAESAIFIASAWYGYDKTSDCREAKDELMQRLYRPQGGAGFGPGGVAPYQTPYDPWVAPPPGSFSRPDQPAPRPPASSPVPVPAPVSPGHDQSEAP